MIRDLLVNYEIKKVAEILFAAGVMALVVLVQMLVEIEFQDILTDPKTYGIGIAAAVGRIFLVEIGKGIFKLLGN